MSPQPVAALQGIHVVGVSSGGLHTLALAADGSVYGVGLGRALDIGKGVNGEGYPAEIQIDSVDVAQGQKLVHNEQGQKLVQQTPKKIGGLVCRTPRSG
jgi:alpha-tubulin suppressor-like RCC1 family protein